jgi:hypothetical protein
MMGNDEYGATSGIMAGETEVLGENLTLWDVIYDKSHKPWPGLEPTPSQWEAND